MLSGGCGIICEYNPFHTGHKYQIEKVKELGAEYVVCVMSGDFVQRAEPAFQDKLVRAQNAVKGGADIVLELPFPFSSAGAEAFAKAGVEILSKSGLCTHLAFGSECCDIKKLSLVAKTLDSTFYKEVISEQKKNPFLSFATLRQRLIEERLGKDYAELLSNPNDILGVEYIKANNSLENPLTPITVKRTTPRGSFDQSFASSSFIRSSLISKENLDFALKHLPQNADMSQIYCQNHVFYSAMLISLMLKSKEELSEIAEIPQGCEYSIIKNAKKAKDITELYSLLSSKTLTDAKIRRMLLFAFLGVKKQMLQKDVCYTNLLAFSSKGREILKAKSADRNIIIASRISDIKADKAAFMQYSFARSCQEVLDKCRKTTLS